MSGLELNRLGDWFARKGRTGRVTATPISGGQSNPTFFVDVGDDRFVLRKKPSGALLKGAHAIEREFRVMQALGSTDVPVPKVLWLEENPDTLGTPFYVMERVEGRVFSDCTLPGISPEQRREMFLDLARTLARLHAVRPDQIGLKDFGRPGNYFERQIARWSGQYLNSDGPHIPELDFLSEWLPANMPADDGAVSIAHGDFRLGNMMFHPTEPRIVAVLDWELSTLGHPLADLGFCVIPWHSAPDEYGGLLGTGWEALGVPKLADVLQEYYQHARATVQLKDVHVAFAMFRFAVIFHGIADRARAGNANANEAAELGPLAERFARRACDLVSPAQQNTPTTHRVLETRH